MTPTKTAAPTWTALDLDREAILGDYTVAVESREASLLGRKEVLTGKAKFGIFGDGKEVPQLALARVFRPGDFRSGYYRDQTLLLATGLLTLEQFFAQLYADPDPQREPCSAGRQMNAHFATRLLAADGSWLDQTTRRNSTADLSPTGSQMPRLVGLAHASRLYRQLPGLAGMRQFSHGGDEIALGTIGDASCAEGMFWEAVNAAGVLGAPLLLSIWDDGYGISVPNALQVTKGHLSQLLAGFQRTAADPQGFEIHTVAGWDYPALCDVYARAAAAVRRDHVPAIVHVVELTQPQGHSTSGSQERYKSAERLAWEREHDCLRRMRRWLIAAGIASAAELAERDAAAYRRVREAQRRAWEDFRGPLEEERRSLLDLTGALAAAARRPERLEAVRQSLARHPNPLRREVRAAAREALIATRGETLLERARLASWLADREGPDRRRYGSALHAEGARSALAVAPVPPATREGSPVVRGFEVLNACFDAALARLPNLVAFGEDLGKLGDVNQGFVGLQEKHGELRVSDTGIRETTIIGQAIGLALRGIRPIAEVQYLDYLLYALQILADDLATLRWRSAGLQQAPVIVRTRGHRLEGVWHSGSPMAGILGLVRGVWLCVPRNMTQAAGFYNTLLAADDPGIVVEVLNGYRLKERLPENIGQMRVPLGVPEVLREGADVTLVTYGACCRIALEAAELLAECGVEAEVLDVQTLLPFDREARIAASLRKTGRILFVDEDVPGGATAYMMREVLEVQGGWAWLDAPPRTLPAAPHRPAYGSDGDYFSKPNRETIFAAAYELVREAEPRRLPPIA